MLATPTCSPRRVRKRRDTIDDGEEFSSRKRLRRSDSDEETTDSEEGPRSSHQLPAYGERSVISTPRSAKGSFIDAPVVSSAYKSPFMNRIRPRALSHTSSYSSFSIAPSSPVAMSPPLLAYEADPTIARGLALMRTASISSVDTTRSTTITEFSAKTNLRNLKLSIDFVLPDVTQPNYAPIAWSLDNMLYFTRGNRVHFKNVAAAATADVGSLCKLQDAHGCLRVMEYQPNTKSLALGTSAGCIQIWDVQARKMTLSWTTKEVSTMAWNDHTLTVGTDKGVFRHFDTRIKPQAKMKEQAKKVTRHQVQLTRVAFNNEGKLFATADAGGVIHCWDIRDQKKPLEVGEIVQRRKKMQHFGSVSALTWCPWSSRLLASGSTSPQENGDICIWDVNASMLARGRSDLTPAGRIRTDAQVTSLHFSPQCKELLSTHGDGPQDISPDVPLEQHPYSTQGRTTVKCANSVAVHAVNTLETITTETIAESGVAASAMNLAGTKAVFAVPKENVLKMWDTWGGKKMNKRQMSLQSVIR